MNIFIKRALISVSDKTNLADLGEFLSEKGIEIISTGGSAEILRDANAEVIEVSDFTKFPEIMDGRVKTLQPIIHGGILAVRGNADHEAAMIEHGIKSIDLVIVNLYPFEKVAADAKEFEECIENIDIGGPALIRAAAKNHAFVTVVIDPSDYGKLKTELILNNGSISKEYRMRCAAKAFSLTGVYDAAISNWFNHQISEPLSKRFVFGGVIKEKLRYGENPHQIAAFYRNQDSRPGIASAKQLQGKELSYNNLNDTDAAFELVAEYSSRPACVIVKHANPCGVALGDDLCEAYKRAVSCDQESAFGGVIAFNQLLDAVTAEECIKLFSEVIIAPGFSKDALGILKQKKNIRVLETENMPNSEISRLTVQTVSGGYLVQSRDNTVFEKSKIVTKRAPSEKEMEDLKFAFIVAKHVKSNAIVYAKNCATVGIGAGQMSRVNSARIATWKAAAAAEAAGETESWALGSVVASDAFFPFADGLLAAAKAGVSAVIQPGGSKRDEEVILAADDADLAMVFTGMRHFRH